VVTRPQAALLKDHGSMLVSILKAQFNERGCATIGETLRRWWRAATGYILDCGELKQLKIFSFCELNAVGRTFFPPHLKVHQPGLAGAAKSWNDVTRERQISFESNNLRGSVEYPEENECSLARYVGIGYSRTHTGHPVD
jgi:hypothetical protein